jgi:hypothetical protein
VCVEDIAFVGTFRLKVRTEDKNLSQVAAGGVKPPAGRRREGGDLRGAGLDQIGEIVNTIDRENVTAIAGARDKAIMLIEAESLDKILV